MTCKRQIREFEPIMTIYTYPELAEIIRAQQNVLRLLLLSIVLVVFTFVPLSPAIAQFVSPAILLGYVSVGFLGAIFIYRLARAIHEPVPWLYVIGAFIPMVNTVTLLVLNLRATAALRANAIEIGLMGARKTPELCF